MNIEKLKEKAVKHYLDNMPVVLKEVIDQIVEMVAREVCDGYFKTADFARLVVTQKTGEDFMTCPEYMHNILSQLGEHQ